MTIKRAGVFRTTKMRPEPVLEPSHGQEYQHACDVYEAEVKEEARRQERRVVRHESECQKRRNCTPSCGFQHESSGQVMWRSSIRSIADVVALRLRAFDWSPHDLS